MDRMTFDSVNWEDLRDILALRPKIYQLWFGEQCGTGEMLRRWDKTAHSPGPNCGVWKENAGHLNRCTSKDQRLMLIKCTEKIKERMVDNHTYPELIEWVPTYLLRQGRAKSVDLGGMLQITRKVGVAQDKIIGWRHFMEGKIS